MDVLSDVMALLELRGRLYCRSELTPPWSMRLPADAIAHFHVVEAGEGWLHVDREAAARALRAGDLIVLPHGSGHTLTDRPGTPPVPLDRLLPVGRPAGACHRISVGGGGAPTATLLCGAFTFDGAGAAALLAQLPPVLLLRSTAEQPLQWLAPLLEMLSHETGASVAGSALVAGRIIDIIFVQALRAWIAGQPEPGAGAGWLRALRDPELARALAAMHREPGTAWTVAGLARAADLSRSAFAARFSALVGAPPMTYLARWRMALAAAWLRAGPTGLTRAVIAERLGYESEIAFARAFKRHHGVSPAAYRDTLAASAPAA